MSKDSGEGEPVPRTMVLDFVEGVLVAPKSFRRNVVRDALKYKARPDDIFLATYPKSGCTWTQYTLWFLFNLDKLDSMPTFTEIMNKYAPFLEMAGRKAVEAMAPPRLIKHHLTFTASPYHPDAKYVVIVRNPFDCVVSFYHHCLDERENVRMRANTTFDEFFEDFMDGYVQFGNYFEHVLSWYAHRNDPNVFFFYYENFKSDPKKTVLALAKFVDASIWERLRTDNALLSSVLERISFDNLKSGVVIGGDHHQHANCDEESHASRNKGADNVSAGEGTHGTEGSPDDSARNSGDSEEGIVALRNFFRKGQVGDWKRYFKPEQERRLRDVYEKRMRGTEMWDVWKDYLGYHD